MKAARKARNRLSSAQLTAPAGDGTEGGGRSHRRRPTVSRRPSARLVEEDEKVVKEVEDEVKTEKVEKLKLAKDEVEGKPLPQLVVPTKVGTSTFCFFQVLICLKRKSNHISLREKLCSTLVTTVGQIKTLASSNLSPNAINRANFFREFSYQIFLDHIYYQLMSFISRRVLLQAQVTSVICGLNFIT